MKLFVLMAIAISLFAAPAFVDVKYVQKHLDDPDVRLVDVGTLADYNAGHIKHAVHTDISDWRAPHGAYQLMRTPAKIENVMRSLGINQNDHVILYGHNKPKENLKASYVALAMWVNGHERVSLLDGHYLEYDFCESCEVSKTTAPVKPGNFTARFRSDVLVDRAYVLAQLHRIPMIEARPPEFYFGKLSSRGVARIGHIAGAMSYTWTNSFNEGMILPEAQVRQIVTEGMQLSPENTMLAYCTGGLEASMNWYVLTRVLHFKDVKVYDASMREWGNRDDTPMVAYRWEQFSSR